MDYRSCGRRRNALLLNAATRRRNRDERERESQSAKHKLETHRRVAQPAPIISRVRQAIPRCHICRCSRFHADAISWFYRLPVCKRFPFAWRTRRFWCTCARDGLSRPVARSCEKSGFEVSTMPTSFDRSAEDLGNIVSLEHVNVTIPDQRLATLFYVAGLGLTRDPYIMVSTNNMWINVGRSQFHLPTNRPQVLRGHVGIVIPDRTALLARLARVREQLDDTAFAIHEHEDFVETVSPWGNRIRCYTPKPRFGRVTLGLPYVEFEVPPTSADGIAR